MNQILLICWQLMNWAYQLTVFCNLYLFVKLFPQAFWIIYSSLMNGPDDTTLYLYFIAFCWQVCCNTMLQLSISHRTIITQCQENRPATLPNGILPFIHSTSKLDWLIEIHTLYGWHGHLQSVVRQRTIWYWKMWNIETYHVDASKKESVSVEDDKPNLN